MLVHNYYSKHEYYVKVIFRDYKLHF